MELFSKKPKTPVKRTVTYRISEEVCDILTDLSNRSGMSRSLLIESVIKLLLNPTDENWSKWKSKYKEMYESEV